jgi:cob(I)alamin adenosyltransferase
MLATTPGQSFPNMPSIEASDVTRLEKLMDHWQESLHPLKEFILPGGGGIASALHLARTICRRAERRCVSLLHEETVDQAIVMYLNRLSDLLFVLARWVTYQLGEQEVLWERTTSRSPE